MVLYVPRVSISTTVRKAFSESPLIGARKLPAAPNIDPKSVRALFQIIRRRQAKAAGGGTNGEA
jgi:hypothetical protein